jgi:hypothetical protein
MQDSKKALSDSERQARHRIKIAQIAAGTYKISILEEAK